MSAWKSTLLLPTLFLSSTFAAFAPARKATASAGLPLFKTDVYGFWSMDMGYGPEIHVTVESFFMQDGTYETRTFLETEVGIERLHGFGAWAVRGNAVVTMPSPTQCKSLGDLTEGCGEASSEFLTLEVRDGVKTLILDLGEELGIFVSPRKAFTLPDLFQGGHCNRNVTLAPSFVSAFRPDFAVPYTRAA